MSIFDNSKLKTFGLGRIDPLLKAVNLEPPPTFIKVSFKSRKMQKEMWENIRGFEDYYQISNLGRVKGVGRYVAAKNNSRLFIKERFYIGYVDKKGYVRVSLSKNKNLTR